MGETEDEELNKEEKEIRSRKNRPTGSIHFGDGDFDVEDEFGDATWGEVFRTCCCHTPQEWGMISIGICFVAFFLYFFLFGLDLLGSGAKVMSGCKAGELFGDDTNPIAGLMVGILATVLLQSSSTTTSIIVSLTGSAISVKQGIYMVMGANIGTSVTNTIVAMGQMGDGDQLERAFSGATVHDMFNFMVVAILLPIEVVTGYLFYFTKALVKNADPEKGEKWEGPIKKLVAPLGKKIIIPNKSLIKKIADNANNADCSVGGGFYPIQCDPGTPTYGSCNRTGLIACDKKTGDCPAFFSRDNTSSDDKVAGGVIFFISICILFFCLIMLVAILQKMLLGMSTRIVYKATDVNGYIAIAIGAAITMLVQSSSITTSTLTPLVGMGVIRLEQMYPLTLGANIGTTGTALLAALVSEGTAPLQVALAHLFFNISGIAIFYPIPFMRRIPLYCARQLGKATRVWRGFPILYIAVMFVLVPMIFLGLSALFEEDGKGFTVLASFVTILLSFAVFYTIYVCQFKGGKEKCGLCMANREKKRIVMEDLPEDMEYLKTRMVALIEHTGLPVDDEDEVDDNEALTNAKDDDEEARKMKLRVSQLGS
jgi:sodium-dependent phosphate cotransporter